MTQREISDQVVHKLHDADAMLNAGKDRADMLQVLEVSEATYRCRRNRGPTRSVGPAA